MMVFPPRPVVSRIWAVRWGGGPPPWALLRRQLRLRGWRAQASGIAPAQFRSDAPWDEVVREGAKAR